MKKTLFMLFMLNVCVDAMDNQAKKSIIAIHVDHIAQEQDQDGSQISWMRMASQFSNRPLLATKLGWNSGTIKKNGQDLAKNLAGAANVTKKVLEGYSGITDDDIHFLTHAALNPSLNDSLADLVSQVRKTTKIIGIADQDPIHHSILRKKIGEEKMDQLLDGTITVHYIGEPVDPTDLYKKKTDRWFVTHLDSATSHTKALRDLARILEPQASSIVVIDVDKPTAQKIELSDIIQRHVCKNPHDVETILRRFLPETK